MKVSPWYIPGSLRNLPPSDGKVTGFQFIYREPTFPMVLLYVIHRMSLFVDGTEVKEPNLRLTRNGITVPAVALPTTDWVLSPGEAIQYAANYPGGLSKGTHTIRINALFGGKVGGVLGPAPRPVVEFQAEIK